MEKLMKTVQNMASNYHPDNITTSTIIEKRSSFFPESEFDCCNPLQPLIQRGFFQTHPRCHKRNILSSLTPRVRSQLYSWSYNFANVRNCHPGPIAYWSGLMTACCNLKLSPRILEKMHPDGEAAGIEIRRIDVLWCHV